MTIEELIDIVGELKPNSYDDDIKIMWLSNLDWRIWIELFCTHDSRKHPPKPPCIDKPINNTKPLPVDDIPENPLHHHHHHHHHHDHHHHHHDREHEFRGYNADTDQRTQLLVPEPYAYDVYVNYLCACIDRENGEMEKYNNSIIMYNAGFTNFAMQYNRTNKPKKSGRFRF